MSTLAFNTYAVNYDRHFTFSPIGILQRKRVFKYLLPYLQTNKNVLEINCGTGEDAVSISSKVQSILASDISPAMILEGEKKKEKQNIQNLEFLTSDLTDIHNKVSSSFDLVFSNFGGLNCVSPAQLKNFADNISPRINPQGKLIFIVMGRKCLWEDLFFYLRKDERRARRRASGGVSTTIEGESFKTYYYSPLELAGYFDNFKKIKVIPIGLFIPPSYLNSLFTKRKKYLLFLSFLETVFGRPSLFSDYADHYMIVLEKT